MKAGTVAFGPLEALVGVRLRQAHGAFVDHWYATMRALDVPLSPVQGGVVLLIRNNPEITQADLARALDVESPSMVQVIDRLQALGVLERQRSALDRRSFSLILTADGLAMADRIEAGARRHEAELLAIFTEDERGRLTGMLERLRERAKRCLDREAMAE